jgi:predicted CoA-binding protein
LSAESHIVTRYRTLAVVGLSSDGSQTSYAVSKYLQEQGYRIIPVNPYETEVLGERAYADLRELPEPPEVVLVFRRSEFMPEIVEGAIAVGAKAVWMQQGIENEEAATRAREAGLDVVMDRCMRSAHRRLTASA